MTELEFCDARIAETEKHIAEASEAGDNELKAHLERELVNYKEMRARYVGED
jgi:hypothetical protein